MTRVSVDNQAGRGGVSIAPVALAALLLFPVGCGGGGGSHHRRRRRPAAAARSKAVKRRGGSGSTPLATYPKVPGSLRRKFTSLDFKPDPSGELNRDPFQSFVVDQTGQGQSSSSTTVIDPTDVCKPDRTIATSYSLRDLRLTGIVLLGTKSYAMFSDTAKIGHIVHRGDCLGKEKALVKTIGAGFVRLEVIPEAPQGAAAPTPQEREILLHPDEYHLPTHGEGTGGR